MDKQPAFLVNMKDDPELFKELDRYRKQLGWTWKRLFLVGVKNMSIDVDNSIVHKIDEYLEG